MSELYYIDSMSLLYTPPFLFVLVIVTINLLLTFIVYFRNPKSTLNRIFGLLGSIISIWLVVMELSLRPFAPEVNLFWIRLSIFLATPINLLFYLLAHTLPDDHLKISKKRFLLLLTINFIVMTICITPFAFTGIEVASGKTPTPTPGPGLFIFTLFIFFTDGSAAYVLIQKYRKSVGVTKEQFRYVMWGILLMHFLIFFTILIPVGLFKISNFAVFFPFYTLIFLGCTSYAIIKHRFLDVRLVVARSVSYSLLTLLLGAYYAFVFFLVGRFFINTTNATANLVTSTFLALTMAFSFQSLRRLIESITDSFFYKGRYDSTKILSTLSHILSTTLNLEQLSESALNELVAEMKLSKASIVLTKNSRITWSFGTGSKPKWNSSDKAIVPLIMKALVSATHENILVFDELAESEEKQLMRERDISILLPLIVKDEVIGAMLLGEKASGDIYSVEDIELLKILAPEIALAVKNAESYEEIRKFNMTLEEKVREATDQYKKVNEQVYVKNVELNERNKTLSLLRKLDEIILGSVTDTRQIAQQVSQAAVSEIGFKAIMISLVEKSDNTLTELAVAPEELLANVESAFNRNLHGAKTSLDDLGSAEVTAVNTRKMQVVHDMHGLLSSQFTYADSLKVQQMVGITCVLIYPLIVRGEVIGAMSIGIAEDEKDLSAYERDLIERLVDVMGIAIDNALLYQKIEEANSRLKEVDKLKDEFVSVASHELRTPMTAIKSYLWLALAGKGGVLSEKQKFYLERSYNSTNRLIKLVNDMLNVSRIESGRMDFEMEKLNLNELIEEIISEVQPRADELGVKIIIDKNSMKDLPSVIADSDKIKEIVVNLVGNSLKFTQRGGNITLRSEAKDDMVITHVTDTGQGIAADDIPKLFQKFSLIKDSYQTNQAASQGTGLGLYICKSIMKMHKGDIWAESPGKGKGATFSFSLKKYSEEDLQDLKKSNKGVEGLGIIHSEV